MPQTMSTSRNGSGNGLGNSLGNCSGNGLGNGLGNGSDILFLINHNREDYLSIGTTFLLAYH